MNSRPERHRHRGPIRRCRRMIEGSDGDPGVGTLAPCRIQPPAAPLARGEFLVISGEEQAYGEDDADKPLAGPASVIIAEAR